MTSEHQAVKEFVIPRKGGNTQHAVESSRSLIEEIPLGSEDFRNVYWAMFCKHLSGSQKDRNVTAIHCAAIKNRTLEKKFKAFQKKLEDQDEPSEISYGFYRLLGPPRETELIAQHGLFTGNSFVGDLGDASKGVHLNESPDLVTPSKFLEKTRLQIMAFKVLKGRTNLVGLSSFTLEPTAGCASHTAKPPAGAESLSRHELFRYNQVYLYEENDSGTYANVPANVLPFAVFTVEFPPNTTTTFKYVPFTVWNGGLKVGERRYTDLMLQSSSGIFIRPPFFGRFFEITDLVPWKACLDYPPIIDLLSHQTIGKLSTKKEVLLQGVKRLATYFILRSQYDSSNLSSLHESMRVRCVAGISVLASGATVLVIPNGEFSSLLALPCREGPVFHCLHFSKTLTDSLLTGTFEPLTIEENDEFNRLPNVGERVDGQDVDVQNIIEQLSSGCVQRVPNEEIARNSPIINPSIREVSRHPVATPENLSPADMDIVTESDDEEMVTAPRCGQGHTRSTGSSQIVSPQLSTQNERPTAPSTNPAYASPRAHTFDEAMREVSTALETAKATTRVEVYRSSRDPRQRPRTGATALPLPRVGILPVQNVPRNSTSKLNDLANAHSLPRDIEKRKESNEEANREDQRCYSPSQAISDEAVSSGPSPPSVIASPDQSPSNFDMVEKRTQSSMSAVVTLDNDGDVLSIKNESPASPPPDKNVYIAPTPKIISECDTRPSCEQQPLHITSHTYQAPEISLFANMRGSAINNFQLSNAGLQKLNEMGVRWGASAPASKPIGPTSDSSEATSSPFTKNERSADGMTAVAQRKISKGGNDKSCNMSRFASVKEKSCETRQPAADKAYERQTDRPSRWETDRSSTCAPTDIDYRTILPQLASASTKTSPHGNAESIIARSMTAGISISAGDRDDRTILTTVAGVSAHVAQPIPSDLKPPRLLEAVPPPVSPNLSSNQSIRGLDIVGQAPHAVMENLREIDRGPGGHSSGSVPLTIIQGSDETARGLSGHIFTSLPPRISPKLKVNEATRGFGGNLLRPVPPPAISNEMDGGPGGHPIISGPVKGIPTCKPIPLNSIRPRQPGLLGERPKPPCFLTSVCISAGGARAPLAVPPPRLDTTRPPPANSIQRSPFENMVPGGYGFFNRPTLPTTPHCASSSSYSSTLDSVVAVDFPNGLRQKGFIVPDGKLFVQALMHPGELRSLLERFFVWRQKWNVVWRFKVHSHVLIGLSGNRDTSDPISNTSKRYSQYNHILNEFIPRGCIELLKSHECDDAVNAALACDYLECVARIARDNGTDTKIIFLSGVNPNAEMSQKFEKVGVEVCNFQQLMEKCGL